MSKNYFELIALSFLYILAGIFGVSLVSLEGTSLTIIWLPSGIGAIMAIRFGWRGVATVLLSSFVVNAPFYADAGLLDIDRWLPVSLSVSSVDALQSFLIMYLYKKFQSDLVFYELNAKLFKATALILFLPTLITCWMLVGANYFFGFLDKDIFSILKSYITLLIADTTGVFLVLPIFLAFKSLTEFFNFFSGGRLMLLLSLVFIPILSLLHQDFIYISFVSLLLLTYRYNLQGAVLGVFVLNAATILLVASGWLSLRDSADAIETYVHTITFIFSTGTIFYLMSVLFKETEDKAKLLIQQSKMATMGEMINAISHQWKQPITSIYLLTELIESRLDKSRENDMEIERLTQKILLQLKEMDRTVTDFRDFLKPSDKNSSFALNDVAKEVYQLNEAKLNELNIEFEIHSSKEYIISGNPNEMKQALLNIYSNACDALEDSENSVKKIDVYIEQVEGKTILSVQDNAGGIDPSLLPDKLFFYHISTKGDKGTGIGLHISKTIIENKFHGKLWARNYKDGAEFIIELNRV
jgi:signal transduction histidine kinase